MEEERRTEPFQAVIIPPTAPMEGMKVISSRRRGRKERRLCKGTSGSLVSWRSTMSEESEIISASTDPHLTESFRLRTF